MLLQKPAWTVDRLARSRRRPPGRDRRGRTLGGSRRMPSAALALHVKSFTCLGLMELSTSDLGRKTRRQEPIER
jgi:hypothetical protein